MTDKNKQYLCRYKDSLGKPGEGLHSYRLFGLAIADVVMTVIGGLIIGYLLDYPASKTILFLFILGIILHRVFCVDTTVDKMLETII
jgi:hypothetical protein